MKSPKFRVQCEECGATSNPLIAYNANVWLSQHRTDHLAPHCEHRWRPMGLHGARKCTTCDVVDRTHDTFKADNS